MFYCLDEKILRKMLLEEDTIDWSSYFIIAGNFTRCVENIHYITSLKLAPHISI